ncbi:ATP-binding protein [Ekhidna sp.]|uniref:ATP-binding protein n=1 Tax=Ekhidna sp. TaxID=2608089 RepID=UPI00329914D6
MFKRISIFLVFVSLALLLHANGDSWEKILRDKKGVVEFYWYPNNIVIENSLDIIDGVEHDLANAFIGFINETYGVEIEMQWIETDSFGEVLETIKNGKGGTFGSSSISITPDRRKLFNFTPPYLADVAVLITNANLPIALTDDELRKILNGSTAISITNTTLIQSLENLKKELSIEFEIEVVRNSGNIIKKIGEESNSFGYIDIANFLVAIESNTSVRRQFYFPVKLEGLAMIFPKESDWSEPVNVYFKSEQFQNDKRKIIEKYLGANATGIIEQISKSAEIGPLEEIVLSNREKESQYEQLLDAARRDQDSERLTIILVSIIIVGLVILFLLLALYRIKSQNTNRLLEQQRLVEDTNNKLRGLNEEKNNLIQVLAHDLRSPLSNILNGAQIIESNEKLSDQGNTLLGFILQSSEKMRSLIDKILDVDAIETGKHNINLEKLNVEGVIEQVLKDNRSKAKGKSITLAKNLEIGLYVKADKVYTAQILDNLISNAIKYSKEKSTIEVSTSSVGRMTRISVTDQGPGLTEEDKIKLFKKYQRLSAKPTQGEASIGLGLSIVKLFTERMGGTVSFDTQLGVGTTFHVDLQN